ncbi:MAG: hypothetical protein DRP63_03985 [Planctomycetota bacterium]|nr:MAG: hypothetical protein DRP63_03985 [Planctomycetota bacterium]
MEHIGRYLRRVVRRQRRQDIAQGILEDLLEKENIHANVTSLRGETLYLAVATQQERSLLEGFFKERLLTALREGGLMVAEIRVRVRRKR